jgi:hypothetical protein
MPAKEPPIVEIRNFKGTREQLLQMYPALRRPANYHRAAKEDPPGDLNGQWIIDRHLDEEFSIGDTFETKEEAIAAAPAYLTHIGPGETFSVGLLAYTRTVPGLPHDVDRLIEDVGENNYHEWSEASIENWTAVGGELDVQLTKVWDDWVERHGLYLDGYTAEEVEQHVMPDVHEPTAAPAEPAEPAA